MNRVTRQLGIIALVLAICTAGKDTQAQVNLVDYAYPVSGWVNTFGPQAQGSPWVIRKAIGDFLDVVMDTVDLQTHPLLNPTLGPFISKFHQARWWQTINTLSNSPAPAAGVRVLKLYSSSWVIQGQDATGGKFTFGVDVCAGPFDATPYTPNNVPVSNAQIIAMANILDAYFITHIHGDHLSPRLIYEMLLLGKPIIATQEVKNEAVLLGAPHGGSIIVPTSTAVQNIGPLSWTSFQGWQYGSFLDAAQTIPNVSDPFNVTNNSFMFSLNGKDIIHFGDNNDVGIVGFLQTKLNQGWTPDLVMNLGQLQTTLAPMLSPEQTFLSHDLEFHHFGNAFLSLLVNPNGPNLSRRALIWGESVDVP